MVQLVHKQELEAQEGCKQSGHAQARVVAHKRTLRLLLQAEDDASLYELRTCCLLHRHPMLPLLDRGGPEVATSHQHPHAHFNPRPSGP